MDNLITIQDKHTAGDKVVGFDYQFYYFMYLVLDLKHGDKIGFEVKDDVHIDMSNGITILYQTKHTISTKADGTPENLTTLDIDLWKTLSNWVDMIKSKQSILENHIFYLVTNKSDETNKFIESLNHFKKDLNTDNVINLLKLLRGKTKNSEIKGYLKNILSLGKKLMKQFLLKLTMETGTDDIINKIKDRIYEHCHQEDVTDSIFDSLSSNLNMAKYLDIKDRKKFEITFDEFNKKFGKCFHVAYKNKPLPKRCFSIVFPENLEEQIFIKQLLDIEDITSGDPQIVDYTTHMLQAMNHFEYWIEQNFILPTEIDEFRKEAILNWKNEFRSKYRYVERKIKSGCSMVDLETDIKEIGVQLIDFLRKENLLLAENVLTTELSNGYYYLLSDTPEIGWHYDWKNKYKTI